MSLLLAPDLELMALNYKFDLVSYCIVGFFEDKNFHKLAFPRFSRG